ncbi:MAG: lipopolysaccharide heptosyltransferase II [Methylotenera sp.]|uniref:lipopolysaccharide heptosyltransferase II n=1 Tax=Methylotenera sp. TaxID=2051956 RepID=UPI000D4FEE74|nr:lipopolysaccharide heptosyltransferase II [Methylotenera sp.]PPC82274.1 MAG: lipopolysaccharide heptosyltransferase II [Methylotenera sp.]
MTHSTKKILVLGPAWVGDMVMAQSLFKVLKEKHPDCIIDVAAPAWTLPLLERMAEVSGKIALPFKHGELAFFDRIKFGQSLRSAGYTQAIVLTNSLKSALLPWAANIKQRTSYLGEMRYGLINDIRPLDKTKLKKTVERFVNLGLDQDQAIPANLPIPTLTHDEENALSVLNRMAIDVPTSKILGLCPGAEYGEAKRWPIEYYAEVANQALSQGWQVWLFGSEKDIQATSAINQITKNRCADFGGKTKLGEAIDLMAMCNTVISNDSGLMHVAAALGKRLIAIYGSSDPHHTPPMHPDAVVEYLGLACSPCFKRECPLGHLNCLKQISTKRVASLLNIKSTE